MMPYESDPTAQKLNDLVSSRELYFGLLTFDGLSPAEQVLIGVWELVNEVYNGGFAQYFLNSSRDRAEAMIQLLHVIDANQVAAILEEAMTLIGPGTRWGAEFRPAAAMPEETRKVIKDLELTFYNKLDDLHLLNFRYLSKHRNQIDADADFWTEATSR
jgi:Domain of unknown function (DUF4375)